MFITKNEHLHNLSIGILVFGIGAIGLLRMVVEIAKKHSKDYLENTNAKKELKQSEKD